MRNSIATAHSRTARRRWRTRRAVCAFRCHIGERISSTSALVTSETGILPMRGKANRLRLDIHSRGCLRIAPSGPLLFQHTGGGFGEGGDALATSLLGERVPALAGELAVRRAPSPGPRPAGPGQGCRVRAHGGGHGPGGVESSCGFRWAGQRGTIRFHRRVFRAGRSGGKRPKGPFGDGGPWAWSWLAGGLSCLQQPFPHYMGDVSGFQGMM